MEIRREIEAILPECWSDDIRMDVLFAPFRMKRVNPENYESKLKFWKSMIARYCEHKGSSTFCIQELRSAFERKSKIPYGLDTVLEDLGKEIKLESDFLNDSENTWSGWVVNSFVKKPFQWSLGKLKLSTSSDYEDNQKYVHLDILQEQCNSLDNALQKLAGTMVPLQRIKQLQDITLNEQGLYLCLLRLHSLKKVFIEYKLEDGQKKIYLVKIADKYCAVTSITEIDRSLYALEQTEQSLIKTINEIEMQITKHENLARQHIREGKKVVAKSYLRRKHQFERNLEKHSSTLDNIQGILARIHETQSNGAVLDAYSIGSQTLKSLLSSSNVNADHIDEIVDNIKESIEIYDEVQQSLVSIQLSDKADDPALEHELMELMSRSEQPENKNSEESKPKLVPEIGDDLIKQLKELDIVASSFSEANIIESNIVDK